MSEKIEEFVIHQPLTAARRKALEGIIDDNAHLSPGEVSYEWESPHVLLIVTHPVKWEVLFHARKIEVYAEAPFWARMLFTKKKRDELVNLLRRSIKELGFLDVKPAAASPAVAKAKPAKKTKRAS